MTTSAPKPNKRGRRRESHSVFAERLGVSPRTVDRWIEQGILPQPDYVRGRKYWDPATKPRRDADAA
jgi:hypothetical protein